MPTEPTAVTELHSPPEAHSPSEAHRPAEAHRPLGTRVLGAGRARHAFESCVEQLATAIRLGAYPDGSLLPPERELAATMRVSRATLREAIAALRQAQMVETTRGRGGGTTVRNRPSVPGDGDRSALVGRRDELLDSLDFRRIVEPGACELAAHQSLSPSVARGLRDLLAETLQTTDTGAHRRADSRLHLALAAACGSSRLLHAVTEVQADLHDMLITIPVLPVSIDHSHEQHTEIVEAVLTGDADRARVIMQEHCDDTAALLRGLLR